MQLKEQKLVNNNFFEHCKKKDEKVPKINGNG